MSAVFSFIIVPKPWSSLMTSSWLSMRSKIGPESKASLKLRSSMYCWPVRASSTSTVATPWLRTFAMVLEKYWFDMATWLSST